MDSIGKAIPWTQEDVITPPGLNINGSCILRLGGMEFRIIDSNDTIFRGFYFQSEKSLTADFIARFLLCSYQFLRFVPHRGGKLIPGSSNYTGALGAIQRGEMDLNLTPHAQFSHLLKVCRFTRSTEIAEILVMMGMEFNDIEAFSFLKIAPASIWVLIFASFLLFSILVAMNLNGYPPFISLKSWGQAIFSCWSALLARPVAQKVSSITVFLLLWIIFSFIVMGMIFGHIQSVIAVPRKIFVSSIQDLIERKEFKDLYIYTIPTHLAYTMILKVSQV